MSTLSVKHGDKFLLWSLELDWKSNVMWKSLDNFYIGTASVPTKLYFDLYKMSY